MVFQLSPGVNFSEIDNTTSVPAVATTGGAFVGNFRWGPVLEVTTITNETELVSVFGAPNSTNSIDFHTASYFLKYANNLKVVRNVTSAAYNANAGGHATTLVKNLDNYNSQSLVFANVGLWVAKYPGALGNSLRVSLYAFTDSNNDTDFAAWTYATQFDSAPGTSQYVSDRGGSNDEMHIIVVDEDGLFTGTPGTVLERFAFVSQASDAKNADGSSNYYATVINNQSQYIWFGAKDSTNLPESGAAVTSGKDYATADADGVLTVSLTAGVDSAALSSTEFASGWDLFEDPDTTDVSLLICPNFPSGSATTIANDIISIAVSRKDAIAFASPESDDLTAAAIKTMADALTASSYAAVDSGRLKVYDKYNDAYINIPACSSSAGLAAKVEYDLDAWFPPAGPDNGQLFGVTKLYYNPSKTDRDTLFKAGVNPVVSFPGQGFMVYGDKTHLNRPSAFDEIGVRRLFIVIEKAISVAAKAQLFKFNNEFTRAGFINVVEPYLRDIQGRQGVERFRVVCDETNNTSAVINSNRFVGDIYIQPSRSIRNVQINFIATRAGDITFEERIGVNF